MFCENLGLYQRLPSKEGQGACDYRFAPSTKMGSDSEIGAKPSPSAKKTHWAGIQLS